MFHCITITLSSKTAGSKMILWLTLTIKSNINTVVSMVIQLIVDKMILWLNFALNLVISFNIAFIHICWQTYIHRYELTRVRHNLGTSCPGSGTIVCHNYCEHHFLWYFKYYFTYDYFFFTVRSPCRTAWPVPKSPSYFYYLDFSQILMLKFLHSLAVQISHAILL